jgi:uncharacterized protein YbjT (DUF2867 family)
MRVLVTGAYGFIGSQVVVRLIAEGHQVVGAGRSVGDAARRMPQAKWIAIDFNRATRTEEWLPHLSGVDAVVNCVGLFQDSPGNSVRDVQVRGTDALFAACERAGIRRVIHVSAVGVAQDRPSDFSRTKREADQALMARNLDWVILRPSVVIGRAAFGGSALLRGLAALPWFVPIMPQAGPLQVVHIDDLAATVAFFLRPDAPSHKVLEIVGPERLGFTDVVLAFRRWLGLAERRLVNIPAWLMALMFRLGDFVSALGWRPPIRGTGQQEIALGAVGDPTPWTQATGIKPRSVSEALAAEPASIQEKWFARLYFLKPLVLGILVLFWVGTGITSLGPGYDVGYGLMKEGGVEGPLAVLAIVGGGLLDILIGLGIAFRRTTKWALMASLILSVVYAIIGTIIVPRLWIDPLGPMLKIWPIFVFTLVALAIRDDR